MNHYVNFLLAIWMKQRLNFSHENEIKTKLSFSVLIIQNSTWNLERKTVLL